MLYILTLSWNGCDKLAKLHKSLMPSLDGIDYLWCIKDNGSTDQTVETVSKWEGNIKVFPYVDNKQNFSEGCNYLFNEITPKEHDYILLLNNDIIFNDTTSIRKMLNIIKKDDGVGAVGARLLYTNTKKLQHAGVVFNSQHGLPCHYRAKEESDNNAENNRLFQIVTGAVLLTKAGYFKKVCTTNKSGVDGMDENYHWAFDDVDLCLAIRYSLNKKIVYCGSTNIFHEESASLKKIPSNKLFMTHNVQYLVRKWRDKFIIDGDTYSKNAKYNLYKGE